MDGKGRALDNIFIERLWRSLKYEYVYLNVCNGGVELFAGPVKLLRFLQQSQDTPEFELRGAD
ncbi:MAG: hypothetical protein DI539_24885 [Flavobacterium psychrophilum]|nr:MAG: hypothetical protein DI539_24885 [Flavobacterium psychrophilum]